MRTSSHAQSLDPHQKSVSHLSDFFSFPVERTLHVSETHTLKSLSNNSRLGSPNRANSLERVGKPDDVQGCIHALLHVVLCLFLMCMRSREPVRSSKNACSCCSTQVGEQNGQKDSLSNTDTGYDPQTPGVDDSEVRTSKLLLAPDRHMHAAFALDTTTYLKTIQI